MGDVDFADGPLFRATIASSERRILALRRAIKAIVHHLAAIQSSSTTSCAAHEAIDDLLVNLSTSNSSTTTATKVLDGLWEHSIGDGRKAQARSRSKELQSVELLLERFRDSYARLKSLEGQTKQFESDAKVYYDALGKYLSIAKPDLANDDRHRQRSTVFDECRSSYLGFLDGLIGSEENAVAYFLDCWLKRGMEGDIAGSSPDLVIEVVERSLSKDAREEGRGERFKKIIKSAQSHLNPVANLPHNLSLPAISSQPLSLPSGVSLSTSALVDGFGVPIATRRREGFLWATREGTSHSLAGDGGGSWCKYWCVLSNGVLTEYVHWKTKPQVNNTAIDLRYASVRRSSSQHSDRRFIFEVLTPKERRVYQCTSQSDVEDWITSITKSIESLLIGNSSMRVFDESRLTGSDAGLLSLRSFASASTPSLVPSSPLKLDILPSSSTGLSALSNRFLGRRVSTGARKLLLKRDPSLSRLPAVQISSSQVVATNDTRSLLVPPSPTLSSSPSLPPSPASTLSDADRKIALLVNDFAEPFTTSAEMKGAAMLRNGREIARLAEEARTEGGGCADCGKGETDWTSYNLGIFLCIRCCGIHRSLGAHISKVRSVTLDDWSNEQMEKMIKIGNQVSNQFFEARKPSDLIVNDSTITNFIANKYCDQLYTLAGPPIPPSTPSTIISPPTPTSTMMNANPEGRGNKRNSFSAVVFKAIGLNSANLPSASRSFSSGSAPSSKSSSFSQ